jgi:putative radical SAM enzyme (TIGR03279 family)
MFIDRWFIMEITNIKEARNIIEDVELGSIADELEINPGDVLLSINSKRIKDVIDYKYMMADEYLLVEIEKPDGDVWEFEIEKDPGEDLGIIFTNPLIDRAKTCNNKCMFCFIDQLPPNMRDTLYFKDDDSRLSFLQGNFITLTNMGEDEIQRIIDYRLSPINVSVHTTNPELRVRMLRNKNAGKVFDILKRFHEVNIEMNCQIVLVPGVNDGDELIRTINDLSTLYPSINSVAVVPVGITKYRQGLDKLDIYDRDTSAKVIMDVEKMQGYFLEKAGTRFIFASDEFYVVSCNKLPEYDEYEGFPQYENGVGLLRSFKTEVEKALEDSSLPDTDQKLIFATGTLAYDFIREIAAMIMKRYVNLRIEVVPIRNNFFGATITVSGLVTGRDLVEQVKDYDGFDKVIIPRSMLKRDEDIFLDNITLEQAIDMLGIEIAPSMVDGKELINLIETGVRS